MNWNLIFWLLGAQGIGIMFKGSGMFGESSSENFFLLAGQVTKEWTKHSIAFIYPLITLAFLATAPHPWYIPLSYFGLFLIGILVDLKSKSDAHSPQPNLFHAPFTLNLILLCGIQLINCYLLIRLPFISGFFSWDVMVGIVPVAITASFSGGTVAHEFIHRRNKILQFLGRLILTGILFDHFFVNHIRVHHQLVGTPEDPATAFYGETYFAYLWRTSLGVFKTAWHLESNRLKKKNNKWYLFDFYKHQVLHGLLVEITLIVLIGFYFGPGSLILFFLFVFLTNMVTQAVTYFEHYGLTRKGNKIRNQDSWDTDSWFSLYSLLGLSRHADHHCNAVRPFQLLKFSPHSPRVPHGYFVSAVLVIFANNRFRRLASNELQRLKLGRFAST